MSNEKTENGSKQNTINFEDALDLTGVGKYNAYMLMSCCLLILAMYLDIFGFSVILPVAACDLDLTTNQQAILSAIPLIGVMISSYAWGLSADTLGRRRVLLAAMSVGIIFNLAASLAPDFASLATLKLLSAAFTSSANAAGFVLVGETTPKRLRNKYVFLMASTTMSVQFIICLFALPIFNLSFHIQLGFLVYRPWRLLMQIIALPGTVGVLGLLFLYESPKYLLSRGLQTEAAWVLHLMAHCNGRGTEFSAVGATITDDEDIGVQLNSNFLKTMKDQTLPLFTPPLLRNSLIIYFILLSAYMTSTGFTMWVPSMTNAYFSGNDASGLTFCEVASSATGSSSNSTTQTDCDNIIQRNTLYAVMCYSGVSTILNVVISFIVNITGKRLLTLVIFTISVAAGVALIFLTIPLLSIGIFFVFLYVALILGNMNSYLVEVNPTHLRGMATCISVIVARGFGFVSIQVIAALVEDYCQPMLIGYIVLHVCGGVVALFLPKDNRKTTNGRGAQAGILHVTRAR